MNDWAIVSAAITSATGKSFSLAAQHALGGGCINRAFQLRGEDDRRFFVKLNAAQYHAMFAAEAAGLGEIATTQTIRVPQPIAHGIAATQSFLVLEHLDLKRSGNAALLGEQLAALHRWAFLPLPCLLPLPCRERVGERVGERVDTLHSRATTPIPASPLQGGKSDEQSTCFGFAHDNFIGSTPQPNGWMDDWIVFWRERRLGFQLRLAAQNGHGGRLQNLGEKMLDTLPAFFAGYTPQPSLLHGDLWGGNHAYLPDGTPVLFDPAAYYGDRECDLAMTELFGGFDADFHEAYRANHPLGEGYAVRRDMYNLYHILNHANLFGGGYAMQAEATMQRLLAEIR